MEQRAFKPGVYTHYKEGTKYLAYEDPTDEATLLPRISYFALDKPEKKWTREQAIFMDLADPNPEINKTGQEFKFEFFSNEFPLFDFEREPTPKELMDATETAFKHLHVTDKIRLVTLTNVHFESEIRNISLYGVGFLSPVTFMHIPWTIICKLYKIYGE